MRLASHFSVQTTQPANVTVIKDGARYVFNRNRDLRNVKRTVLTLYCASLSIPMQSLRQSFIKRMRELLAQKPDIIRLQPCMHTPIDLFG